jgi:hypothetical protein
MWQLNITGAESCVAVNYPNERLWENCHVSGENAVTGTEYQIVILFIQRTKK